MKGKKTSTINPRETERHEGGGEGEGRQGNEDGRVIGGVLGFVQRQTKVGLQSFDSSIKREGNRD